MAPNKRFALVLCILVILASALGWAGVAAAQDDSPGIVIEWPNEGETLYAGPSSLLYHVPIKGRVTSGRFAAEEISVTLEIFKDSNLIGSLTVIPDEDGYYELQVTVNPEGPTEQFEIAFVPCGVTCHSPAKINLPSGKLALRVTASDPDGRQASAERHITVDISDFATVPVHIFLDGEEDRPVSDVDVLATTWLYMWRSRFASGRSDVSGVADVRVEALGQAPTEYVFKIDPTVVDGVLYEGVDFVEVVLEPGAKTHPPIELAVTAHQGHISGSVSSPGDISPGGLATWAIRLPGGSSFQTVTSESGEFDFSQLPLDQYLITLDNHMLMQEGLAGSTGEIDISKVTEDTLELVLKPEEGRMLSGRITDEKGDPLPFAWARAEGVTGWQSVLPGYDGQFTLTGLPDEAVKVVVSAPGYFGRVMTLNDEVDIPLTMQDETTGRAWGTGEIIIPAGTNVRDENGAMILDRGWVWGDGEDGDPQTIWVDSNEVVIDQGNFALEYLPGNFAWLYLFDGTAELDGDEASGRILIEPGQMVNLLNEEGPKAVPLDPVVVRALDSTRRLDVPLAWEPTLGAQIRDRIAWLGVGTAQVVTFVTYFVVTLSLILLPLLVIYWWWRRKKEQRAFER